MIKLKMDKNLKYLEQGMEYHRAGKLSDASVSYGKLLKRDPLNPEALNLMGVVFLQLGNPKKAIELISKALLQDKSNPGYLNNLGQAWDGADNASEALKCYQKALKIQPNDPDVLNNLGNALKFFERYAEAISAFEKALTLTQEDPSIYHNFGVLLQEMKAYPEAIKYYRSALLLDPSLPTLHGSLASALESLGESELAVQSYLFAIKLDPFYIAAHEALKKIRWAARDINLLHESYIYACKLRPNSASAYCNLAQSLFDSGHNDAAFDKVKKALDLDATHSRSYGILAALYRVKKKYDLAIKAHQKEIEHGGDSYNVPESFGLTLSLSGDFDEAVSQLLLAHKKNPRVSSVLGNLTVAMNEIGDTTVANYVNYDTYVTTRLIDVPDGFRDLDEFNNALHEELVVSHGDRPPPEGQTMRGGTQIPNHLFKGEKELTAVVKNQISLALRKYIETLTFDPDHPFLRFMNPNFRFTGAWSTILYGSGYDTSHVHNAGWLSGVYYLKIPDLPDSSWANGEGCIQFGEPPANLVSPKNHAHKLIRPREGTVVFFPSYYWHGVKPFKQDGIRHAISFDII
jgi:tetratricopeptide (TPR) repeat protein